MDLKNFMNLFKIKFFVFAILMLIWSCDNQMNEEIPDGPEFSGITWHQNSAVFSLTLETSSVESDQDVVLLAYDVVLGGPAGEELPFGSGSRPTMWRRSSFSMGSSRMTCPLCQEDMQMEAGCQTCHACGWAGCS